MKQYINYRFIDENLVGFKFCERAFVLADVYMVVIYLTCLSAAFKPLKLYKDVS